MLTCQIMGGLGNQLFQIFTVLAYGIQHNTKVVFPYYTEFSNRYTYWNSFLNNLKVFTTANDNNNITNEVLNGFQRYPEKAFAYEPLPDFGESNIFLPGYYQSYKYFESNKETITNMIDLENVKKAIVEEFTEYFVSDSENEKMTTISMHFRLGDYKKSPAYHPIIPYEYYANSLRTILDRLPIEDKVEIRVLFFCEEEDNEYVSNIIERVINDIQLQTIEFVKVNDSIDDWKQMIIMSCCDHNIIANSTFSWWGAYLNDYTDKIVCRPSLWFGYMYGHYDLSDLCPPGWIKIEV